MHRCLVAIHTQAVSTGLLCQLPPSKIETASSLPSGQSHRLGTPHYTFSTRTRWDTSPVRTRLKDARTKGRQLQAWVVDLSVLQRPIVVRVGLPLLRRAVLHLPIHACPSDCSCSGTVRPDRDARPESESHCTTTESARWIGQQPLLGRGPLQSSAPTHPPHRSRSPVP